MTGLSRLSGARKPAAMGIAANKEIEDPTAGLRHLRGLEEAH